jgi:hypothetical protein
MMNHPQLAHLSNAPGGPNNLASHIHANAAQLAAAAGLTGGHNGIPLSHTLPPNMAPIAYALNHPMVHGGQAAGLNHQSQFNYMYSEGSEDDVDDSE